MTRGESKKLNGIPKVFQDDFIAILEPNELQQAFDNTTTILYTAFVNLDTNRAQLFAKWGDCFPLIQHVIALKNRYSQEDLELKPSERFCELLVGCQRYLNGYLILSVLVTKI